MRACLPFFGSASGDDSISATSDADSGRFDAESLSIEGEACDILLSGLAAVNAEGVGDFCIGIGDVDISIVFVPASPASRRCVAGDLLDGVGEGSVILIGDVDALAFNGDFDGSRMAGDNLSIRPSNDMFDTP